jgi:hypothetical protein
MCVAKQCLRVCGPSRWTIPAARAADAPTNKPVAVLRNPHETGHLSLGVRLVSRPYRDAVAPGSNCS